MNIDLTFEDLSARATQYNARASVEDFDACMADYAALAQRAKASAAASWKPPKRWATVVGKSCGTWYYRRRCAPSCRRRAMK